MQLAEGLSLCEFFLEKRGCSSVFFDWLACLWGFLICVFWVKSRKIGKIWFGVAFECDSWTKIEYWEALGCNLSCGECIEQTFNLFFDFWNDKSFQIALKIEEIAIETCLNNSVDGKIAREFTIDWIWKEIYLDFKFFSHNFVNFTVSRASHADS